MIQPTGLLARIQINHEEGARLEVISQKSRLDEIGLKREKEFNSHIIEPGVVIELYGKRYEITSVSVQVLSELNSSYEFDEKTYFTSQDEQLPNNVFIYCTVKNA